MAIRLRPFVQREIELGSPSCIKMNEKCTTLLDFTNEGKRTKTFSYDYSSWSHDGFEVDETG